MSQGFLRAALLLAMLVTIPLSCGPTTDTRQEFANGLMEMSTAGVRDLYAEVLHTDQLLSTVQLKLRELEQVQAKADEWIAYQKTLRYKPGSWVVEVKPEGLKKVANARYQAATLSFTVKNAGTSDQQFLSEVMVTDLIEGKTDQPGRIRTDLKLWEDVHQKEKSDLLKSAQLATSTLEAALGQMGKWKISKSGQSTYSISGPGLGWSNGLAAGRWTYDGSKKEAMPVDKSAIDLQRIITGKY